MGRLPHFLSYGAPSTRALRARVELRWKQTKKRQVACFYPLKQFRTFLDFTLGPPSERIPAILERFGLRRLVHYKSFFLGEYATKVLKRSTPPHPGIKIGSKCQQILRHARACPRGRHPVMVADTCIIVGSLFETTFKIPAGWTSQDSENDFLPELIQERPSIDGRSRKLQPRTKLHVETVPPVSKHLWITTIPFKQNGTKRPPPHPFSDRRV